MKHILFAAAFVLAAGTTPALAVDVVNEDQETYSLTIAIEGAAEALQVLPGDKLIDVCERCQLSIEEGHTIEAAGDQVAVIKGGAIQLMPKAN